MTTTPALLLICGDSEPCVWKDERGVLELPPSDSTYEGRCLDALR